MDIDTEFLHAFTEWERRKLERWNSGKPKPGDDPEPTRRMILEKMEAERNPGRDMDKIVDLTEWKAENRARA